MANLLRLAACLSLSVSLNSLAVPVFPDGGIHLGPFETVSLNAQTHMQNYIIDFDQTTPFYFTDSGDDRSHYGSNENYYITFYSNAGLRLWVDGNNFNYFDFEEFTYSQYDRLGFQVGQTDELSLENFQTSPSSTSETPINWLQTSSVYSPSWSSNFDGSRFNNSRSMNGWIFPSNNLRAENLGHNEGEALDLYFSVIRFYFSSDSSKEDRGWFFSVYPLEIGSPVPLPAGILLFLSGLIGLGVIRLR